MRESENSGKLFMTASSGFENEFHNIAGFFQILFYFSPSCEFNVVSLAHLYFMEFIVFSLVQKFYFVEESENFIYDCFI